jgi:fused signal recognition particle receptor
MGQEKSFFTIPANPKPYVILIVGVNGTGKTTTIGKIASRAMQGGNKVMVAAADTFRAAATEQLEIWAQRAGVPLIKNQPGVDPASVAFDALNSAIAKESDLVLIDTAGRLHTKVNLMEELKKMKRVLGKRMEGAPHEIWLVIDATTGQNGISQAKLFNASLNLTGLILTKLDGTAKGGIAIAIKRELGIPVKMIGIGETLEDLRDFDSEEFINALFADADEEEAE